MSWLTLLASLVLPGWWSRAMLIEARHGIIDNHGALGDLRVPIKGGEKEGQRQGVAVAGAERVSEGRLAGVRRQRYRDIVYEHAVTARGTAARVHGADIAKPKTRVESRKIGVDRPLIGGKDLLAIVVQGLTCLFAKALGLGLCRLLVEICLTELGCGRRAARFHCLKMSKVGGECRYVCRGCLFLDDCDLRVDCHRGLRKVGNNLAQRIIFSDSRKGRPGKGDPIERRRLLRAQGFHKAVPSSFPGSAIAAVSRLISCTSVNWRQNSRV